MIYVIVPAYNVEKYIARCFDSILNNNFDVFIICVNDGSTDSTKEIIEFYCKNNKNILLINQYNQGPSKARNTGLDYLQNIINNNDFITFIDADDFIDQNYFETLVSFADKFNSDIVCSSCLLSTENRDKKIQHVKDDTILSNISATKLLLEDKSIQSHSPCKLYKSFVWDDVRYPEDIVSMEDQATIYKTFLKANLIYVTNYTGYHYWQGSTSICRSEITNKKIYDSMRGYYSSVEFLSSLENDDPKKECLHNAINGFFACFLMVYPRINKKHKDIYYFKIRNFIKKIEVHKLIKLYKPNERKEKIKLFFFKYLNLFYALFYKIFVSITK